MAETSFPVAGGAGVTDAAYEKLMGPITGSGRVGFLPTSTQLSTPLIFGDNSGRQVKALANQAAIVRGFRWESGTTPPVVALDANTSGNPRIDLIVLRLDRTNFTVRLGKTNGTPAALPVAPAAIQDAGTDGHWELPVATVRVASSGTTGQPFIQSGDVTSLDWWIAPPPVVTSSLKMPPASHGAVVHQYDTGRVYRAIGSAWTLDGEIGAATIVPLASGWSAGTIRAQRLNGWTYFEAFQTSNMSPKAANTDITLCVLPADYRPLHDTRLVAWMTPSQIAVVVVQADNGRVYSATYATAFPTGGQIVVGATAWPNQ